MATSPQSSSLPSYEANPEFERLPVVVSASLEVPIGMQETDEDRTNSTVIPKGTRNLKRPATERSTELAAKRMRIMESTSQELEDLDEAAKLFSATTTEDSDGHGDDESSEADKRFMKEAQEEAQKSRDTNTRVGAVIVDPEKKEVIARGWNRMPEGCKDRFADKWSHSGEDKNGLKKHYYVVFAARAAIFDGLKNGKNLKGCIMYTNLYPSNVCAQCIRDVEIAELWYVSDKFHDAKFMVASREILEGIKCRPMKIE